MTQPATLGTASRVTLVVGAGLVLAPALILMAPDGNAPAFFETAARIQIVVGCLVLTIGVGLRRGRSWARTAALMLLRAAIPVTTAWTIYANVDAARMAPTSGIFVGFSILVTIIWIVIFLKGIAYLNESSLRAELGDEAQ